MAWTAQSAQSGVDPGPMVAGAAAAASCANANRAAPHNTMAMMGGVFMAFFLFTPTVTLLTCADLSNIAQMRHQLYSTVCRPIPTQHLRV
jgi:hypothetical protein